MSTIDECIIDSSIKNLLPLAEKIYKINNVKSSSVEAYAFAIFCIKSFFPKIDDTSLSQIIFDDTDDCKFDGMVIKNKSATLFDFKKTKTNGIESQIAVLKDSISSYLLVKPNYDLLSNIPLKDTLINYHKKANTLHVYIMRNSINPEPAAVNEFRKWLQKKITNSKVTYINRVDIIDICIENNFPDKSYEFTSHKQEFFHSPSEALAIVPLKEIIEIHKEYITKGSSLFFKNIRGFCGKTKITEGMSITLENQPKLFHLFHNGITIVTNKKIKVNGCKIIVHNPQIVNGAQTISTLFNTYKNNLNDKNLGESKIICKFINTDSQTEKIFCETSNSQKAINISDLRTNDSEQIKIKKYLDLKQFRGKKYAYILKGKYKSLNGEIVIKFKDFMQWAYAALMNDPSTPKNSQSAIFTLTPKKGESKSKYGQIVTSLLSSPSKIDLICTVGEFVKKQTIIYKGLHRDMSLHIIAAMYNLNPKKDKFGITYNKIANLLKNYYEEVKLKDDKNTPTKIFAQSKDTWLNLKKELKIE